MPAARQTTQRIQRTETRKVGDLADEPDQAHACARCARVILKKTELTSALLSICYLLIIVGDLVASEISDQCDLETEAEAEWRFIYTQLDLGFLIFFGIEICFRICSEGHVRAESLRYTQAQRLRSYTHRDQRT